MSNNTRVGLQWIAVILTVAFVGLGVMFWGDYVTVRAVEIEAILAFILTCLNVALGNRKLSYCWAVTFVIVLVILAQM